VIRLGTIWGGAVAKRRTEADPGPPRVTKQGSDREPSAASWGTSFGREEIEAAVVKLFCDGVPVAQIAGQIGRDFKIEMTREAPWRILGEAARDRRFRYSPRSEYHLADRIKEAYPSVHGAELEIVNTAVVEDVARVGAERLLKLVCQHNQMNLRNNAPSEVHVGFAGGRCLRLVADEFARLLTQKAERLPRTIYIHAMIAGFNMMDPTLNPLFFFSSFTNAQLLVETRFVGMFAPGIVSNEKYDEYRKDREVSEAFEESKKLNIIVTSAGNWDDAHTGFKSFCDEQTRVLLENNGCIGDLMWHPLFPRGVGVETEYRALTLRDPDELPAFIDGGGDVLLVLGPCSKCYSPKSRILGRLLEQEPRLVTRFVVDSRSARGLFEAGAPA
jgi:hypothetical protein